MEVDLTPYLGTFVAVRGLVAIPTGDAALPGSARADVWLVDQVRIE